MSDDAIKALEALRQTAPFDMEEEWCKRALAALRAEQPAPAKACAGFVCSGKLVNGVTVVHLLPLPEHHEALPGTVECRCRCGQPYSAHQPSEDITPPGWVPPREVGTPVGARCACGSVGPHACRGGVDQPSEQPARKVEVPSRPPLPKCKHGAAWCAACAAAGTDLQPAKVGVPPMPMVRLGVEHSKDSTVCASKDVHLLHAFAVALAERCEGAEQREGRRLSVITRKIAVTLNADPAMGAEDAVWKLAEKYNEARAQLAEAQAALGVEQAHNRILASNVDIAERNEREARAALKQARAVERRMERGRIIAALKIHGYSEVGAVIPKIRALPEGSNEEN